MARKKRSTSSTTVSVTVETVSTKPVETAFMRPIDVLLREPPYALDSVKKVMERWNRKQSLPHIDHPIELVSKRNIEACDRDGDLYQLVSRAIADMILYAEMKAYGGSNIVFVKASEAKALDMSKPRLFLGDITLSEFFKISPETAMLFYGKPGSGKTQTSLLVALASSIKPRAFIEHQGYRYGGFGGYAIYIDTEGGLDNPSIGKRIEEINQFLVKSYRSFGVDVENEGMLLKIRIPTVLELIDFLTVKLPKLIVEMWQKTSLSPSAIVVDTVVAGLRTEITQGTMVHRHDLQRRIMSSLLTYALLGVPVIMTTQAYESVHAFFKEVHAFGGNMMKHLASRIYQFTRISVSPKEGIATITIACEKGDKPHQIRVTISDDGFHAEEK